MSPLIVEEAGKEFLEQVKIQQDLLLPQQQMRMTLYRPIQMNGVWVQSVQIASV